MATGNPFHRRPERNALRPEDRQRAAVPPGDLPLVCPDHHTATDPANRCDTCGTRWIGAYRERTKR